MRQDLETKINKTNQFKKIADSTLKPENLNRKCYHSCKSLMAITGFEMNQIIFDENLKFFYFHVLVLISQGNLETIFNFILIILIYLEANNNDLGMDQRKILSQRDHFYFFTSVSFFRDMK